MMKKKTKITLVATTFMVLSLTIIFPRTMPQEPTQSQDIRPVSAFVDSSRDNTPPPSVNSPPQPTEKEKPTNTSVPPTEMPTKPTTPPPPTSTEPKMGDSRIIDGRKQSYFLGFGWVDYMGENEVIYCEGMYENGNKIGILDSDGDINKMVGIMD